LTLEQRVMRCERLLQILANVFFILEAEVHGASPEEVKTRLQESMADVAELRSELHHGDR